MLASSSCCFVVIRKCQSKYGVLTVLTIDCLPSASYSSDTWNRVKYQMTSACYGRVAFLCHQAWTNRAGACAIKARCGTAVCAVPTRSSLLKPTRSVASTSTSTKERWRTSRTDSVWALLSMDWTNSTSRCSHSSVRRRRILRWRWSSRRAATWRSNRSVDSSLRTGYVKSVTSTICRYRLWWRSKLVTFSSLSFICRDTSCERPFILWYVRTL